VILNSGSSVRNVQVVGVVGDVHSTRLERDPPLMVYVPFWRSPRQASDLVVRSAAGAAVGASEVRRVLKSIDPALPAPKIRSMGDLVAESVAQRSFQTRVAGAFGIAALLLAALGIYGVVAYGVSLRRRELGIRMALGAKAGAVCRLVLWRGLRPVLLGLATGVAAALAAGRLIRALLFGVGTSDVWSLSGAALALAFVATLACLIPAASAASINPSGVLREE
jgi:putative ABC transport system permease protein